MYCIYCMYAAINYQFYPWFLKVLWHHFWRRKKLTKLQIVHINLRWWFCSWKGVRGLDSYWRSSSSTSRSSASILSPTPTWIARTFIRKVSAFYACLTMVSAKRENKGLKSVHCVGRSKKIEPINQLSWTRLQQQQQQKKIDYNYHKYLLYQVFRNLETLYMETASL